MQPWEASTASSSGPESWLDSVWGGEPREVHRHMWSNDSRIICFVSSNGRDDLQVLCRPLWSLTESES